MVNMCGGKGNVGEEQWGGGGGGGAVLHPQMTSISLIRIRWFPGTVPNDAIM